MKIAALSTVNIVLILAIAFSFVIASENDFENEVMVSVAEASR